MKINYNGMIRDMTQKEETEYLKASKIPPEMEIQILKDQLRATDYKALKFAEGWLAESEYEPIRAERQEIRNRINALEK